MLRMPRWTTLDRRGDDHGAESVGRRLVGRVSPTSLRGSDWTFFAFAFPPCSPSPSPSDLLLATITVLIKPPSSLPSTSSVRPSVLGRLPSHLASLLLKQQPARRR